MTGDGINLCVLPVFSPSALPAGVVPVKTGALDRIFTLVATIKNSGGYIDTIGSDLGILGTSEAGPDLATVQPVLTATLTRWKYRAIYHLDDAQVGQWSAEVSVTVGG